MQNESLVPKLILTMNISIELRKVRCRAFPNFCHLIQILQFVSNISFSIAKSLIQLSGEILTVSIKTMLT